jgi:hypothetical protein
MVEGMGSGKLVRVKWELGGAIVFFLCVLLRVATRGGLGGGNGRVGRVGEGELRCDEGRRAGCCEVR